MNKPDSESVARTTSSWRGLPSKSSSDWSTVSVPVLLSIAKIAAEPSNGSEKESSPGFVRASTAVTTRPLRADSGMDAQATQGWPLTSSGQLEGVTVDASAVDADSFAVVGVGTASTTGSTGRGAQR